MPSTCRQVSGPTGRGWETAAMQQLQQQTRVKGAEMKACATQAVLSKHTAKDAAAVPSQRLAAHRDEHKEAVTSRKHSSSVYQRAAVSGRPLALLAARTSLTGLTASTPGSKEFPGPCLSALIGASTEKASSSRETRSQQEASSRGINRQPRGEGRHRHAASTAATPREAGAWYMQSVAVRGRCSRQAAGRAADSLPELFESIATALQAAHFRHSNLSFVVEGPTAAIGGSQGGAASGS